MGTTKFLIDDIDWPGGVGGPSAVVVALPDWLVLSDVPKRANALAEWEADWEKEVKAAVTELTGETPYDFTFKPADPSDPIGPVTEDDDLHEPLAGEHEK